MIHINLFVTNYLGKLLFISSRISYWKILIHEIIISDGSSKLSAILFHKSVSNISGVPNERYAHFEYFSLSIRILLADTLIDCWKPKMRVGLFRISSGLDTTISIFGLSIGILFDWMFLMFLSHEISRYT